TPLSSPLPQIPSPPLPASPPTSVLPAFPLPTSSPPLQLLSSDHRADRPEISLLPQKRLGINLGLRCEVGEISAAAAARPIGGHAWVDPRDDTEEVALTTLEGVNTRVIELVVVQEQNTQDIYGVIKDTQDQEAWGRFMEVSYMARSEIMALRSIVMSQQTVISQLQAADCRSQIVTLEMLQADHMRQGEIAALRTFDCTRQEQLVQTLTLMQSLQGQVTTLQGHVTTLQGQQGPSRGPAQLVAQEEAGSSS
ncbi:hypothetical protein Tco_0101625, partial [Tanacetum coccineum]